MANGRLTPGDAGAVAGRVRSTRDMAELAGCQLVMNTSTLPIVELATAVSAPRGCAA